MKTRGIPTDRREDARLLAVDSVSGAMQDAASSDLAHLLSPGDLLVVNDAATLPASYRATTAAGEAIEVRLAQAPQDGLAWAVLFGAGDYHTPTEERPAPERLQVSDRLQLGMLEARVTARHPASDRMVQLRFELQEDALWSALYREGRPIQYAHHPQDLPLWSFQTVYSGRPWAVEMPSAGRPLSWRTLSALRERGVAVASITHAAGLSTTGDGGLDRLLPFDERFEVPEATVKRVRRTRARGGRVVAVGTSVVRALEAAASDGRLRAVSGVTDLHLTPDYRPRVVDGLISGMHVPGESHYELLGAFTHRDILLGTMRHAEQAGYANHEFGDIVLLAPDLPLSESTSWDRPGSRAVGC